MSFCDILNKYKIKMQHTYLDSWFTTSKPVEIPRPKEIDLDNMIKFELKTNSGDIIVLPSTYNTDLISGYVQNTPPLTKIYKKGDKVLFHKANIMNIHVKPA